MQTRATSRSAYRCDTDLLIREILEAAEELWARTARRACRVLVHPVDGRFLITAPIGKWGPIISIDADSRPRFQNMVMFYDPEIQPGMARVEICDGCLSMWRDCENSRRPGLDREGAARLIVDALADLGDEWARPQQPRAPETATPGAGEPEAAAASTEARKRTRRPSKRELERRAETADRKAAEAAAKADRARRALEGGS